LSINGSGKINHVYYEDAGTWQSVRKLRNAPTQPIVTLTLTMEEDDGGTLVTCDYVVQGGTAYRICRP